MNGAELRVGGRWVDTSRPFDLSTRIGLDGTSRRAFGLPAPTSTAYRTGGFVGDTREGGVVNCRLLQLAPHGDGTHTETVAHVGGTDVAPCDVVGGLPMLAALLTVPIELLGEAGEEGAAEAEPDDLVVTAAGLARAADAVSESGVSPRAWEVVVIRARREGWARDVDHSGANPPYLTREAMYWLASLPARHLVVELPSVDRENDGGALANHRCWWGADGGTTEFDRTITELAAVPDALADGPYACVLQVPSLLTDAVPSRPILYPLRQP